MADSSLPSTSSPTPVRYRTRHLQEAKEAGQRFAMITVYDAITASIFDDAGIEVLLVGDSVGNTVLGYPNTLPVDLDQMILFSSAVVRGTQRALVVADLPFGSYELSVEQAVASGIRMMKEAGVAAVKIEGGVEYAEHIRSMTSAGVPVLAHIGFTPQSEHVLGGYRVQGRGDDAATQMIEEARTLQDAGAFGVLMEMVPADVAEQVDQSLTVPTIGIGAGPGTTAQVLVWQDMLGLTSGRVPRFVKQYAQLRQTMQDAVSTYREEVLEGTFPATEHLF